MKMKNGMLSFGLLTVILLSLGSYLFLANHKNESQPLPPQVQQALQFVKDRLINENGIVETYPFEAKKIPFRDVYERESLSETVGLWMLVLEALNQKVDFDQQVKVLKKYFLLSNGTLSWRLNLLGGRGINPEPYSATIDDLRIIRTLLNAYERWGNKEYKIFALSLAAAMKRSAIYKGCLLEQPILSKRQIYTVDLSYLDLEAMWKLSKYDRDWKSIYDRSIQVLYQGQRKNGFFYDKYHVFKKHYYDNEKNFINQLICAIHLSERKLNVDKFMTLLKSEWDKHHQLQGVYNPETGKAESNYESSVIYALAYRLAKLEKDYPLARQTRERIIRHNSGKKDPLWNGSIGQNGSHAFDHLQILLDWAMYREDFWS